MTNQSIVVRAPNGVTPVGIARVCAQGWRDTYSGIYAEYIESVIAANYTPSGIAAELAASNRWDGWSLRSCARSRH